MTELDLRRPATLHEALHIAATDHADRPGPSFVDRRGRVTPHRWGEIASRAQATAGGLRSLGVRPGDRVAIVLPTSIEFFDAFFGAVLAGAIPVPIYPPVRLGRLEEYYERGEGLLRSVDARIVLADPRVRKVLGPLIERAAPRLGLHLVEAVRHAGAEGSGTSGPSLRIESDALAMVQFSSGTTVEPKPVGLSHRAIVAQATVLIDVLDGYPGVAAGGVSWLPLYHDMGLIGFVFPSLVKGAPLTLIGPEVFLARPAIWLQTMSRTGALVSAAPNFAYALCVERIRDADLDGVDLSHWRVALNGAEVVSAPVMRAFIERFGPYGMRPESFTPVYGLSEAALGVTFTNIDDPFRTTRFDPDQLARSGHAIESAAGTEHVSVGRPLRGFDLEIRDRDGCVLPDGQVGRVLVRGPSLMDGYLGRPDLTEAVLVDGWLDTGDLGVIHEGELYLTGRAKDVLIVRGRNHAPQDVEHALDQIDGVRTGCAIAVTWSSGTSATEELLVMVERSKDCKRPDAELVADCKDATLAVVGIRPDEVVVLDPGTLPRTSSGKLRRAEALRQHRAGELRAPDSVNAVLMARATLRSRRALHRFDRRRDTVSGPQQTDGHPAP
jgi:fatty-acyl-CoA synthase